MPGACLVLAHPTNAVLATNAAATATRLKLIGLKLPEERPFQLR
jgi:hypothetical protein